MTTLGKIQWVEQPPLPAKCVCCNNGWPGKPAYMIDFQVSLDEYGALLFCEACAKELAGLVSIESVESRNEQIRNLVDINRELQENNDRLNATLDNLLVLRPNLLDRSGSDEQGDSEDSKGGSSKASGK